MIHDLLLVCFWFLGLFGVPYAGFTSTSDAKQLEYYEDRSSKLPKINQSSNKGNSRDILAHDPASDSCHVVDSNADKPDDTLVAAEHHSESFPLDAPRHDCPVEGSLGKDKTELQVPMLSEISLKTDIVSSTLEYISVESVPVKEEVCFYMAAMLCS